VCRKLRATSLVTVTGEWSCLNCALCVDNSIVRHNGAMMVPF
jgi:hypothetical protein